MATMALHCTDTLLLLLIGCVPASSGQSAGTEERIAEVECSTTPNGIPCKIIATRENAQAYENQDCTGREKPLKLWRRYFIFKESDHRWLVGKTPHKTSILGWVREEDAMQWDTRQGCLLLNKGSVPVTIRIWPTQEDVGDTTEPYFTMELPPGRCTQPLPILQRNERNLRVDFFVGKELSVRLRLDSPLARARQIALPKLRDNRPVVVDPPFRTGWLLLDSDITVETYLQLNRRALDDYAESLLSSLDDYRERELSALCDVFDLHTGGPIIARSFAEVWKAAGDIPLTPDMLRQQWLQEEEAYRIRKLRRVLNNIMVLMNCDRLFNEYGEGWIPVDFFFGPFAEVPQGMGKE